LYARVIKFIPLAVRSGQGDGGIGEEGGRDCSHKNTPD